MNILLVLSPMGLHDSHYLSSKDTNMPIGLLYLASALEKAGHHIEIFDCQLTADPFKEFDRLIAERPYDVIGFSAVSAAAQNAERMAARAKEADPSRPVLFGGVHATVKGAEVLNQLPHVDVAVIGEGEITTVRLLERLESGGDLDDIAGLAFRRHGEIVFTGRRPLIKDLDAIPFPAYHLVDINRYSPPPGMSFRQPLAFMMTARGCPFDCAFCADTVIWQGKCRMRSPENVVDEMEMLQNRFGAREIQFVDDTFTVNHKRTEAICLEIQRRKLDLIWRCSSRVDCVTPEILSLMKSSGLRSISYGVESGDDDILKRMNKKITVEQIRRAVKWAKKEGLETKGFFILNYPGDTRETTEKTIRLARELDLDFAGFNLTIPFVGTSLRQDILDHFPINEEAWNDEEAHLGNQIFFHQPGLSPEYLMKAYRRAALGFYLSPRRALRKVARIRNPKMFRDYAAGLWRLVFRLKVEETSPTPKCRHQKVCS